MNPLAGTVVLDLTANVSGPFATMVLSKLGADVVKIERPPGGDDARQFPPMMHGRSVIFEWCNTGKRSVALDLRKAEGLDVFKRLAATADVVIHSFKPGVVERLGIAEVDVRAWNPDVLYCDISAFGAGPAGRELKGYDPIAQAFSGIMDMTGYEDGAPARCAPSIVDLGNGAWMVIGVLAALLARRGGGGVSTVQASLVDTAVALEPWQATVARATNERPVRRGASHELGAPYDLFATADRPLFLTAANQSLWLKLLEIVGAPHLADQPRFATPLDRVEHSRELADELEARLRSKPAEAWLAELTEAGVPASLVLSVNETVRTEVGAERQWFEHVGDLDLVRLPLLVDGEPLASASPAPAFGQHTRAVLEHAGFDPAEIDALATQGVVIVGGGPQ